jgi:hypothetical protein
MSEHDELAEAIAADAIPPPPEGLAARVASELRKGASAAGRMAGGQRPGRALPQLAALAGGVALGALGWGLAPHPPEAVGAGAREPSAQESIQLGARAVLVAEAGAALRWRSEAGHAVLVEQSRGDVFYRVNTGPLTVETPFGAVHVRGTCFRVEVIDMKLFNRQTVSAAALGAALGAGTVVTVYEGRVLLARSNGALELAPGERGAVSGDGVPRRLPAPGSAADGARGAWHPPPVPRLEPGAAGGDETGALRARIAAQDEELARLRPAAAMIEKVRGAGGRFLDPTREELQARAERCEVRFDIPKGTYGPEPATVDEKERQRLGLSETERDAMNEVYKELHAQTTKELRRLYAEMSGDPATAEKLTPGTLQGEILAKSPREAEVRARQQLSRELAGLSKAPADLSQTSVTERTLRLLMNVGHEFERRLAERIGNERARSLRARDDGWRNKSSLGGSCQ